MTVNSQQFRDRFLVAGLVEAELVDSFYLDGLRSFELDLVLAQDLALLQAATNIDLDSALFALCDERC